MPIPFVCVFVAFLLIYAPRFLVTAGQAKISGGYDNANPRLANVPTLRSTVWTLGMLCTTGLFVLPLVTRA